MFNLTKEDKIAKLNKTIELPEGYGFYDAISYYKQEANKLLAGKGLLSNFNTACMEYHMISEPRAVLYENGIPHDLHYAEDWERPLYIGLRTFLEKNFPQYTKEDIKIKEFDEISTGIRPAEDCMTENDISQLQKKIQELRAKPENWSV